ncbi:ATP-binding protein [Novosphingobium profundi]|uniref:ATP-binding protein n=1 Tax=Novosphingobium profundi TaxID=1774954 RepID=UPI001CFCF768|nr:ATP-binding protein [Novosphingobium profundi]
MNVAPPIFDLDAFQELAESWSLAALERVEGGGGHAGMDTAFERLARAPTLAALADTFALSRTETQALVLLFAAGHSARVAYAVRRHSPHSEARGVPTWLLREAVCEADPRLLAASGPLSRTGCLEIEGGVLPVEAHVRLAPALGERLCDLPSVDPLVAAHMLPLHGDATQADEGACAHLARALTQRDAAGLSPLVPAGDAECGDIAARLARLGLGAARILAGDIPAEPDRRAQLARAWSREAALDAQVLLILVEPGVPDTRIADFADRVLGHVVLVGATTALAPRRGLSLPYRGNDTGPGDLAGWQAALGPQRSARLGPGLDAIAHQFALRRSEIEALCRELPPALDTARDGPEAARHLWHRAARLVGPESVPGVELVEPAYTWSDIVLPEPLEQRLRRIEGHVRHARLVLDEWGFAARMGGRGRGISALLSGPSGTGKSMAAEVLASALDLRVLFIDLSQLISKYIGDTSKNVAAAFRLAERSGAVMVWNEGDAIWGARGSVGNATDRHVNAEVGDLLQRMENFRGFTIVTTNLRHAIDEAFTRRFRFCVTFPMPSQAERLRLWQRAFPETAPLALLGESDWEALARLQLTGGGIRNIALSAAFHAAERAGPIDREIIAAEVAEEFRKQDLPAPTLAWEGARA